VTERDGRWIQTYSGRAFWPLDPRAEDVHLVDIAAALSKMCRYAGHCLRFYSVAEHCVLLATKAPDEHKLAALMHDASEAYLLDVPTPIKASIGNYCELEERVQRVIAERFRLAHPAPDIIGVLDAGIRRDECAANMSWPPQPWAWGGEAVGIELQLWDPPRAMTEFLAAFYRYGGIDR
jgi:hypothetical protein